MGEDKIALGNHPSRVMKDLEIQPLSGCGKPSLSSPAVKGVNDAWTLPTELGLPLLREFTSFG